MSQNQSNAPGGSGNDRKGDKKKDIFIPFYATTDNPVEPILNLDIIAELGKYLDVETMKSARMVSTTWDKGLEYEFRRRMMIVAEFESQSLQEFCKIFPPDNSSSKLITSSVWIKEPIDLEFRLLNIWISVYGNQMKTIVLGDLEDTLSPVSIESILTRYCPNLKVLKIPAPFVSKHCSIKHISPDPKEVKITLDYLKIGHEVEQSYEFGLTSTFLLNVLKCIKSVKIIKIAAVKQINLHNPDGSQEDEQPRDDHAKQVFEKIEELDVVCANIDPRRLFHSQDPDMRFPYLQKLKIGCFCYFDDGFPMAYLPALLTSVKDSLKELVFYKCPAEHDRMTCPKLEDCILYPMPKLEIFKILDIIKWDEPSLNFLEMLPALKQLQITINDFTREIGATNNLKKIQELFNVNKYKKKIVHQKLEQLTYRCCTKSSKCFYNIQICFPNLKKLEVDFCGTPVFYVFRTFKKLKEVTIHLCEPLEALDTDDLEELCGSGIEKLCLENYHYSTRRIHLGSIFDGCLAAESLKKLELTRMKIRNEDYQSAMQKLQKVKLRLWLINCQIQDD